MEDRKFKVVNASGEFDGKTVFALTKSPSIRTMKDCVDELVEVDKWLVYEDEDKKDPNKVNTILSVMDKDGSVRATNSNTFMNIFFDITSIMGNNGFTIKVVSGTSKAGRNFITCDMPL